MDKKSAFLALSVGILVLSACGSDQPDNVGTSSDIVVNNRQAVMAGEKTQDVKVEIGPKVGGGKVVSEDQEIDQNPPVEPVVTTDQSVEAEKE